MLRNLGELSGRPWVPSLWYMYHWYTGYISHCQVVHLEAQRKKKKIDKKDLESESNLRIKTFIFYEFILNITNNPRTYSLLQCASQIGARGPRMARGRKKMARERWAIHGK